MRISPRLAPVVLVAALALVVGGCVPQDGKVTPAPSTSATPAFASDEEALAAATKAFGAYLEVSDQIFSEGGANPSRMEKVAKSAALKEAMSAFEKFSTGGWHSRGNSKLSGIKLQRYSAHSAGIEDLVSVYACQDVSSVDVLDAAGVSQVSPSRPNQQAFEIGFDLDKSRRSLIVATREPWPSEGICAS